MLIEYFIASLVLTMSVLINGCNYSDGVMGRKFGPLRIY